MIYTVNTVLHSSHTVKENSKTYNKIVAANAKYIKIDGHIHKIFFNRDDLASYLASLLLAGGGE